MPHTANLSLSITSENHDLSSCFVICDKASIHADWSLESIIHLMVYKYLIIMFNYIVLIANPDLKLGTEIWGIKSFVQANSLRSFQLSCGTQLHTCTKTNKTNAYVFVAFSTTGNFALICCNMQIIQTRVLEERVRKFKKRHFWKLINPYSEPISTFGVLNKALFIFENVYLGTFLYSFCEDGI